MNTNFKCPNCGAELSLSVELTNAVKKSKGTARMEALAKAGINTDNFFSITMPDGSTKMAHVDDEGQVAIIKDAYIQNGHMFKQHVLAQMFRMLYDSHYVKGRWATGYSVALKSLGYIYTWKMINEELMRQSAMYRHGDERSLNEDRRWFNADVVRYMIMNLAVQLKSSVRHATRHKCKGKKYIKDIDVARFIVQPDLSNYKGTFYDGLEEFIEDACQVHLYNLKKCETPIDLHHFVEDFVKKHAPIRHNEFKQCEAWKDAYKGYGAYFSMQNLIRFHGCKVFANDFLNIPMESTKENGCSTLFFNTIENNEEVLNSWAAHETGYWMLGALKLMLEKNNIDVVAMREAWRKKYE